MGPVVLVVKMVHCYWEDVNSTHQFANLFRCHRNALLPPVTFWLFCWQQCYDSLLCYEANKVGCQSLKVIKTLVLMKHSDNIVGLVESKCSVAGRHV